MDKISRLYKLHSLLKNRKVPISLARIQEDLGCSERTTRRFLAELRDELRAPVVYDRDRNGFHYEGADRESFELPGLWFSSDEIHALLTSYHLLDGLQPGLFEPYIAPIRSRLKALLEHRHIGSPEISQRIRLIQMASRPTNMDTFRKVASATLARKQLRILYHGRERDEVTERTISPQRLVYYRSNWYLDTWCHLRKGLRHFSLDRLQPIVILEKDALDITQELLDCHFASAYGIFAGEVTAIAVLKFSPSAAKWVADEQWHPQQESTVQPDGSYELKVPYSRPEELIMDILKYGAEVEVIGPNGLRNRVASLLRTASKRYR